MSSLIILFICVSAGLLLARIKALPENAAQVLNLYVIWVALPALVLSNMSEFTLSAAALFPMLVAWAALLVSAVIVVLVVRSAGWSRDTQAVLLLLVPLGNTSFLGIPLVTALMGNQVLPYIILYDQLGSFLALATYGTVVVALHSGTAVSVPVMTRKVLTFPPFIALIGALLINLFGGLPAVGLVALQAIGATLVPVVMVAVGLQWRFRLPRDDRWPMVIGLAIKLLLLPLMVWGAMRLLVISPELAQTMVLESAMAPMISAGALATLHNYRPQLVAAMVGYGLLFAFATVPLWWWLLQ
ncbi:MAG: AEC family transporter [Gammaproteobacteria bacterium]|nr:AEC family transporter [Gammaproteobacteria bacterium]NVK89262.1 AEC family transporter [Gammaproteobacteria bacterium]